ncbi:MAG TPA: hypothetical protein VF865_20055 [Acidobacteriaceae bacterium]
MAKRVFIKPDWLKANHVHDIYSVSGCISEDFAHCLFATFEEAETKNSEPGPYRIFAVYSVGWP